MARKLVAPIFFYLILLVMKGSCETTRQNCGPHYFQCTNGRCISTSFICDGENDCNDNSDEIACKHITTAIPKCGKNEFQCLDHLCIPESWVCDSNMDCIDGSDETVGCSTKLTCEDGFSCKNHECIPLSWQCDGTFDCTDKSDEENCERKKLTHEDCLESERHFLCTDKSACLDISLVCNLHADCDDGSDEGGRCRVDACLNTSCPFDCVLSPQGPTCVCPPGQLTKGDVCIDEDECQIPGKCDQICTNTVGSYHCSCKEGYILENDTRTCKAEGGEALLVFTTEHQVRALFLTSGHYFPVTTEGHRIVGVAYDGMKMYWSRMNDGQEAIIKANEDGSEQEIIASSGIGLPEDLAVDWVTHNIYFTDSDYKWIGVCTNDGLVCVVLLEDLDKPRSIALHSPEGLMFWTDWGERPLIARSGMDGSNVTDFVTTNIVWPNGITLDHASDRLFWVDGKLLTVECIKLDGTDRINILTRSVKHPFSIAVFENYLYWTDWEGNEIARCNKFTGKERKTIVREKKEKMTGIHIYHPALEIQVKTNPCAEKPCSDICMLAPSKDLSVNVSYTCGCPSGKELGVDLHNCRRDEKYQFLIIAFGSNFFKIEHKKLGRQSVEELSFPRVNRIGAMTYNTLTGNLIISDLFDRALMTLDLNSRKITMLAQDNIGRIVGMDFDEYGNNLYWVDEEKRTVEVMSLTTGDRIVLMKDLGSDKPSDIVLIPSEGVMFISLHNGITAHVDKLKMDGSPKSRMHVAEDLVGPKISLAYDTFLHRVFWADIGSGNIVSTDADGYGRHKFRELSSTPTSIKFLGSNLFWVSSESNEVCWGDKHGESGNKCYIIEKANGAPELKMAAVTGVTVADSHVCQKNNGGCSHICLVSGKGKVCACPHGWSLQEDKTTCKKSEGCTGSDEYKCVTGECILMRDVCNGHNDCPKGDDESQCQHSLKRCPHGYISCIDGKNCYKSSERCDTVFDCEDKSDEVDCHPFDNCEDESKFFCHSGECISAAWRCDDKPDCRDQSDELNCQSSTCNPVTSFRCGSGTCIPISWECDKQLDCSDGSDEHLECPKAQCEGDLFTCGNGHCVDRKLLCNGADDCDDNSDELNCKVKVKPLTRTEVCDKKDFSCPSQASLCLPQSGKCNGTAECPHGEDELGCEGCRSDEFECVSDRVCIHKNWICDKMEDCKDGSDEAPALCKHLKETSKTDVAELDCPEFTCSDNKMCLSYTHVCNQIKDCVDGSDEGGTCGRSCQTAGCSDICHDTPKGPKCECQIGYQLEGDSRSCKDINECLKSSACSHYCTNTPGSFLCSCFEPLYQIRDDRVRCKAKGVEMEYLYVTQGEIRFKTKSLTKTGVAYKQDPALQIKGLDVDMKNRKVFWTSELFGTVSSMSLESPEAIHRIENLQKPTKIAYDWVTGNVYVVEKNYVIRACHLNSAKCAVIYSGPKDIVIDAIALDPRKGLMFWSETSWTMSSTPKAVLKRGDMSGGLANEIIGHDLKRVTDIAIHHIRNELYWADFSSKKIEKSFYNGSSRATIFSTEGAPLDLGLFEDHVYWLNTQPSTVRGSRQFLGQVGKCGLFGSVHLECEFFNLVPPSWDQGLQRLRVVQPALQIDNIGKSMCQGVSCDHLCVVSALGPNCLCEDGTKLSPGKKCPPSSFVSMKPKFLKENLEDKSESSKMWVLWVFLTLLMIATCVGGIFVLPKYLPTNRRINLPIVQFFNPGYSNLTHQASSYHHNQLVPGEHQYVNPISIQEQPGKPKCTNELSINQEKSFFSWKKPQAIDLVKVEAVEND